MFLSSLRNLIQQTEEIVLAVLLFILIILSCIQISMRLFFDSGLAWADPLLRYVVLWSGMLGAVLAVARNKHISLDISEYLLPKEAIKYLKIVIQAFSSFVCCFLTHASWIFLKDEMEFGSTTILSTPSWVWNLIFPLAFAVMAFRYLFGAIMLIFGRSGTSQSTVYHHNE